MVPGPYPAAGWQATGAAVVVVGTVAAGGGALVAGDDTADADSELELQVASTIGKRNAAIVIGRDLRRRIARSVRPTLAAYRGGMPRSDPLVAWRADPTEVLDAAVRGIGGEQRDGQQALSAAVADAHRRRAPSRRRGADRVGQEPRLSRAGGRVGAEGRRRDLDDRVAEPARGEGPAGARRSTVDVPLHVRAAEGPFELPVPGQAARRGARPTRCSSSRSASRFPQQLASPPRLRRRVGDGRPRRVRRRRSPTRRGRR